MGPLLAMVTSAEMAWLVQALALLLAFDSVVEQAIVALLVMWPPVAERSAVTVTLPSSVPPLALSLALSVIGVKLILRVDGSYPSPTLFRSKLRPVGNVSTITVFAAAAVPRL